MQQIQVKLYTMLHTDLSVWCVASFLCFVELQFRKHNHSLGWRSVAERQNRCTGILKIRLAEFPRKSMHSMCDAIFFRVWPQKMCVENTYWKYQKNGILLLCFFFYRRIISMTMILVKFSKVFLKFNGINVDIFDH